MGFLKDLYGHNAEELVLPAHEQQVIAELVKAENQAASAPEE
ncbi:hypothetical protein [Kutzneria sp. 744]|nr:hypothetical protein [Kutzneria sp. 744]